LNNLVTSLIGISLNHKYVYRRTKTLFSKWKQ
jgi:hypothetical protein